LLARLGRAVEIAFSGKIESLPTNRFVQGRVVRPSIDVADIRAGRAECKRRGRPPSLRRNNNPHPEGTPALIGDFLDKPLADGGHALGRFYASGMILVFISACILVIPQRAGRHPGEDEPAAARV
jgi:hypothetical protein